MEVLEQTETWNYSLFGVERPGQGRVKVETNLISFFSYFVSIHFYFNNTFMFL